jgi:hypothetical protein
VTSTFARTGEVRNGAIALSTEIYTNDETE